MRSEFDGDSSGGVVVARQGNALTRREEQLRRWAESDTSRAPTSPKSKAAGRSVHFPDGIVFLACCHSGDKEDIGRLIKKGADINTANVDGLTALHQACIDDKLEMVKFLINSGVDLDSCDNEGWTPLHATASCGYVEIAQCLIDKGARVDSCNNDGHLPVDLADSNEMQEILEAEMAKQGVDPDASRKMEEEQMLSDAQEWVSAGQIVGEPHSKTGATALHIAAAKGYVAVIELLLRAGADVNRADNDGWTPLHAAAHWGEKEAAKLLVLEAQADLEKLNKVGQTAFDVGDSKMVGFLEDLRDKQRAAYPNLKRVTAEIAKEDERRRSSVTRLSIDEKQRLKLRGRDCLGNGSLESSIDDEEDSSSETEDQEGEKGEEEAEKETDAAKKNVSPVIRPASIKLPVAGGASVGNQTVGTVTPMIRGTAAPPAPQPATTTEPQPATTTAPQPASMTDSMETDAEDEAPPAYGAAVDLPAAQQPTSTVDPSAPSASQGQKRVFEPPKRDEESEAQRKAKSRRARETRRSTQGVTAEDLQAAEILLTAEVNALGIKDADSTSATTLGANLSADNKEDESTAQKRESTSGALSTPTSTATALADTLKQSDSFRRKARASRHDTQDSISSNSSSASSGSSSTSSTLTAGSVAAASPIFSRSSRFGSGSSYGGGGGGDGVGVGTDEAKMKMPSVIVTAGGDAGGGLLDAANSELGNSADRNSVGQAGGLGPDSQYKRSNAITKRKLRAERRSTGISFDEDGEKKEGEDEGTTTTATTSTTAGTTTTTNFNDDATPSNVQKYSRSSGSSQSFGPFGSSAQPTPSSSSSSSATSTSGSVSSLYGASLSANTGIADRYTRPTAPATSYRQAAEMDYKKLYDEEKQENERLRMKLGRVERENAELKSQLEKNQKNAKTSSSTGSYNNNNNAFEGVESLKDKRGLAETLEELKMLENLKADNMRLKEENGALIRVISKLSK